MVRLDALIAAFLLLIASPAIRAGAAPASRPGTFVQGNAWTAENAPIPAARVRLRNVTSGRIQATTVTGDAGQFIFANVEPASYVVELMNESATVLAVSHGFTIGSGETVATFVRLGGRAPWFVGFFGSAGAVVAAGAASQGVAALVPVTRAASAGR